MRAGSSGSASAEPTIVYVALLAALVLDRDLAARATPCRARPRTSRSRGPRAAAPRASRSGSRASPARSSRRRTRSSPRCHRTRGPRGCDRQHRDDGRSSAVSSSFWSFSNPSGVRMTSFSTFGLQAGAGPRSSLHGRGPGQAEAAVASRAVYGITVSDDPYTLEGVRDRDPPHTIDLTRRSSSATSRSRIA